MMRPMVVTALLTGVLGIGGGMQTTPALADTDTVVVDPTPYRGSGGAGDPGYFFLSPTGAINCGILDDPQFDVAANCYAPTSLPDEVRQAGCVDPGIPDPGVWSLAVGPSGSKRLCTNNGWSFGAQFQQPTLPYGHTLAVNGYSCTSRSTGITCVHDRTGHGFEISRETRRMF